MSEINAQLINLIKNNDEINLKNFIKDNIHEIDLNNAILKEAIKRDNSKIIKYLHDNIFSELTDITIDFYRKGCLDGQILKYIIKNNFRTDLSYCILYFIKNEIPNACEYDNRIELLKVILETDIFDNEFIIDLLSMYKNKIKISNNGLKYYILKRKNKVNINIQDSNGETPLYYACQNLERDIVKYLLKMGADPNLERKDGTTPLFVSCRHNDINMVKCLIEHNAYVNKHDGDGKTPLLYLCQYETWPEIPFYLIDHGANVDIENEAGQTPLIIACRLNNDKYIKYLVEHGANLNKQDRLGKSPLYYACDEMREDIVKYLLEMGADPNLEARNGKTPLFASCLNHDIRIAKCLIEHNAYVNKQDNEGESPLLFVCQCKNKLEITNYLIDHGAYVNIENQEGQTPLIKACQINNEECIKYLVERGANINKQDRHGKSPLIYLSMYHGSKRNSFEYLIEKGANVNLYDEERKTALHYECLIGEKELIYYLIEHGANPNWMDYINCLPIYYYINPNRKDFKFDENILEVALYFIEHGMNVNSDIDNKGNTVLFYATANCFFDSVDYLVKRNADVNFENNEGYTPLMFSISNFVMSDDKWIESFYEEFMKIVKYLISHGADINRENFRRQSALSCLCYYFYIKPRKNKKVNKLIRFLIKKGAYIDNEDGLLDKTPLQLACFRGSYKHVKYFVENGANVNKENQEGMTPLLYACIRKDINKKIIKCLIKNGANIYKKDVFRKYPLKYIKELKDKDKNLYNDLYNFLKKFNRIKRRKLH